MLVLTFDRLRSANTERCITSYQPIDDWSPNDWLGCLTGEVGELAHLLKEARRGNAVKQEDIADELADVAIYLDLLAARLKIDLGKAVARKFNRTSLEVGSNVTLPERGASCWS